MSRCIMCEGDRKVNAKISQIKNGIKSLLKLGYKIQIDKEVETMMGSLVDNIYVVDGYSGEKYFKKYLITVREN